MVLKKKLTLLLLSLLLLIPIVQAQGTYEYLYPKLPFDITADDVIAQEEIEFADILIDEDDEMFVDMTNVDMPMTGIYRFEDNKLYEFGYYIDAVDLEKNSAADMLQLYHSIIDDIEAKYQVKAARNVHWLGEEKDMSEVEAALAEAKVDCNTEIKLEGYLCNVWLSNVEGISLLVVYNKIP